MGMSLTATVDREHSQLPQIKYVWENTGMMRIWREAEEEEDRIRA